MFKFVILGDEKKVIEIYRKIYDQGVEPKVFLNDFMELIYYFKNINSLTLEGTNFSLNDEEFLRIKELSKNLDNEVMILFWQFAIKTLYEIDIVANQNLSIEMFLVRMMYLSSLNNKNDINKLDLSKSLNIKINEKDNISDFKVDKIDQIKNITQEKKLKSELETETNFEGKIEISSFDQLIETCILKKEIRLKYELEKNVNLVNFDKNRIEISFNDNLDKNFVKEISLKLFEWTDERWIISLTKNKGEISIKEKEAIKKRDIIDKTKKSKVYKNVLDKFPDAKLINVTSKRKED